MRHLWTVLCTKASIDKQSNNVSLLEVIERILIHVKKGTPRPITFGFNGDLVTCWARDDFATPMNGESRVRVLGSKGAVLATMQLSVDLNTAPRNRTVGKLSALQVDDSGWHTFEMSWRNDPNSDWTVATSLPLEVVVVEE